jgi:hypothetical protein
MPGILVARNREIEHRLLDLAAPGLWTVFHVALLRGTLRRAF